MGSSARVTAATMASRSSIRRLCRAIITPSVTRARGRLGDAFGRVSVRHPRLGESNSEGHDQQGIGDATCQPTGCADADHAKADAACEAYHPAENGREYQVQGDVVGDVAQFAQHHCKHHERDSIEGEDKIRSGDGDQEHAERRGDRTASVIRYRVHLYRIGSIRITYEPWHKRCLYGQRQSVSGAQAECAEDQRVYPRDPLTYRHAIQPAMMAEANWVPTSTALGLNLSASTAAQGLTAIIPANCAEAINPTVKTECVTW